MDGITWRRSLLVLAAAGCANDTIPLNPSTFGPGDAGATNASYLACPLETSTTEVHVSAGGRVEFDLGPKEGLPSVMVQAPDGWRTHFDPTTGHARLRVPYGAFGDYAVTAQRECGTKREAVRISVHVRAPQWIELPAWNPERTGPGFRQLPFMWSAGGLLWMYGGYDRRGFGLRELWFYRFENDEWEMLSDGTDMVPFDAIHAVPVPGDGSAILMGTSTASTDVAFARLGYALGVRLDVLPIEGDRGVAWISGALAYDMRRNRLVAACGLGDLKVHCGVGVYDVSTGLWSDADRPTDGTQPSPRYGFAHAYDRETDRLIIASGVSDPTTRPGESLGPVGDAWALDLSTSPMRWNQLTPSDVSPPGRRNSCFALDRDGHRLFMWGGTPNARDVEPGLFALDLDVGYETWTRVDLPNAPELRASCSGTYDLVNRQVVFGFGNSRDAVYIDLVALKL